ncbi:hypothetical protein K437DRAFT_220647 [Tilletiaria anomala UBC 951]|uniref:Tetraspanin Tsp2 n=1 Tax=Tilletiaria anomala (strain ATCC 24038 / CBS 436.72 / UBC 951) TaxID=1037660 RepID=A0A066WIS4_TILAU|nr:uncharacterized protein K437DRAFT_220647 [Tilletiaria anomala UBC 951]KDN52443.1 hypothetical protein K437DRAFT_220647 [Tilletiaria anomala UBC 951]
MFGRLFAGLFLKKATKADSTVPKGRERLRWNKFKWALFTTNIVLTVYAIGGLAGVLLTWANVWESSDVIRTANSTELVLASIAATLLLITAIIGWCGILLNNRAFLSFYNLFLWISFAFLLAPGYVTYKKRTFNLEGKVNYMWSRDFDTDDRREIQNSLSCCGYYNPFIEAAESSRCYARSTLPGCKGRFIRFQKNALKRFYLCAFGLVIPHLLFIVTALLSSNHITYRFGKGLTPNAYRLDEATARSIKNDFLAQLSSMYGPDILTDLLANQRRRISQLASLEHTNSSTYLLSDNALSPHSFDQVPLAPPNKGALFKGRHDSFSSTGISEKGSPLQQSLGLHDLMHHGASDARTSVERGDTTR